MPTARLESLRAQLPEDVPDPRDPKGRWHPWRAILGILVLAKLCGVLMGQRQVASFARDLTEPQRRALRGRCAEDHPDEYEYVVPAESTFQRALSTLDFAPFQPLLLRWQAQQLGPDPVRSLPLTARKSNAAAGGPSPSPSAKAGFVPLKAKLLAGQGAVVIDDLGAVRGLR